MMGPKPPLDYILNHVFFPPRLPQSDDSSMENDIAICDLAIRNAQVFSATFSPDGLLWGPIIRMLINLESIYSVASLDKQALTALVTQLINGETLIIPVRAQNACVIVRRLEASTIYESFEVDPPNESIMAPKGRLVRFFPGPAHEITDTASTPAFQRELASFLADMDVVDAGSAAATKKAGSTVFEVRDSADPHYITQLLTSILHGVPGSQPADIERVEKRVRNEIMWNKAYAPWRRSPLWLVIRVAIQTTLRRASSIGQAEYKAFMIFLLADVVLSSDECREFSTDLLICIQNKIVRRLRKLSDTILHDALLSRATDAITKIKDITEQRWKEIQSRQAMSPSWSPDDLDIVEDTSISLLSSKDYLYSRIHQPPIPPTTPVFEPPKIRRLSSDDLLHPENISKALSQNPFVALGDIEQLAIDQGCLEAWVDKNRLNSSACSAIGKCINYYALTARTEYKDNPEYRSTMLLTVFLLWKVLDQLAISQHPLLADYSPEISESILDPILLRKSESIECLVQFQNYLRERHSHAHLGSLFSETISTSSFAFRYYHDSVLHKELKHQIETQAQVKRKAKCQEFAKLKAKYNQLMRQAQAEDHQSHGKRSKKKCKRCKLERKASNLSIQVHEWPLPDDTLLAQATVFELQCPPAFQTWRTMTYTILYDFCRPGLLPTGKSPKAEVTLANYLDLKAYSAGQTRIMFASPTKPFTKSHYSTQKIHNISSDREILVNNGLKYSLFDTELERWAKGSFVNCSIADLCIYKLPSSSPYSTLQYVMQDTSHSANRPLADQATVPPELAIHEFISLGTLRSGPVLQWFNILRELRARALSFNCLEVHMILAQAAMQTGTIRGEELQWHSVLKELDFGTALLTEIGDLVSTIESNWHHTITLQTIIILISRLLASSREYKIITRACSILRTVRTIAFTWLCSLAHDLERLDNEDASLHLMRQRMCLVAATCHATYDVDPCYFGHLINSDADIDVYIQCAIHVQVNAPAVDLLPVELDLFLSRNKRMSQNLAPTIWDKIQASRTGIDNSILAIWSDYHPGSDWKQLPAPNKHWLLSTTSTTMQSRVYYNLLDGSLLIDGKPLGRLPSSIIQHPTYIRLLKNKVIDVVPSGLPNMHFATRNAIAAPNLTLHFQLPGPDGNLIIQAKFRGKGLFELVPHTAFGRKGEQDFPTSFLTEYAHWLHLSPVPGTTECITFHPLETIWQPSENNWNLAFDTKTGTGTMTVGCSPQMHMVDIRSKTFRMVSKRLEPLELSSHIHVVLNAKRALLVDLPRYKMSFFLNENKDLECSTIRDMVVDPNQSSGTMYGLVNQLVLRSRFLGITRIATPGSRCVIIPFGKVRFTRHHHHSHITVSLGDGPQKYVAYQVDSTLGRLVGTTLLSDIYRIYLHACTSFPLPDELTGRTGTEEALRELESARSFSFQDLSVEEVALLRDIASLTPDFEWYPKHLRAMQTIQWKELSSLAQHWAFASRIGDILRFQRQMSSIGIGTPTDDIDNTMDLHLLSRLDSRTTGLYTLGKTAPSPHCDWIYPILSYSTSRRKNKTEELLTFVTNISNLSFNASPPLDLSLCDLWKELQGIRVITNMTHAIDSYRRFILPCLSDLFLPIYEMCRQDQPFDVLSSRMGFALSSMAYVSSHADQIRRLLPIFLSFARQPEFCSIASPSPIEYDLGTGLSPDRGTLSRILQEYIKEPPYGQPTREPGESNLQYNSRRVSYWESPTRQEIEKVIDYLVNQWPCEASSLPHHSHFDLLNLTASTLEDKVSEVFLGWYNNMNLREFIEKVQTVLNRNYKTLPAPISLTLDLYHTPPLPSVQVECLRHFPATLEDLCLRCQPYELPIPTPEAPLEGVSLVTTPLTDPEAFKLGSLVNQFRRGPQSFHHIYADALGSSLESYLCCRTEVTEASNDRSQLSTSLLSLENQYELRRREFSASYGTLQLTLSPKSPLERAEAHAKQWPCLKIRSLLGLLSRDELGDPLASLKAAVIAMAQALVRLQRSRRMLLYRLSGREEDLLKELNNGEYETNVSFNDPEWLLIQIDGNFTVRPVQSSVALEMISPRSGQNSLTQLNMGEGKSAVIVPLISSALADGQRLVRIVVLKPLVNQMFDLLVQRLSRLTDRRVFYLPFSRDFQVSPTNLGRLQSLYETCVRERGLLLIQPEHILSFRLMGIDLSAEVHREATKSLIASHRWLLSMARDVLDESDEILRVTYQLVYTSGLQQPMDSHPDRWAIIQEVIGYAQKHAENLSSVYPNGLEVHQLEKFGCAVVRILDIEAGEALIDSVVSEVLGSHRFKLLPLYIRPAASDFIRCHHGSTAILNILRNFLHDTSAWKHLLLYRGLFGHGLLRFVLQEKRWRVDYGLDLSRTLLAVPYRAKDLPSLRADFGHPDVALLLTCLSYYYGGLTEEQLNQCFDLLFKLDDPPLEYNQWVSGREEIPPSFRDIKGVNLDDEHQRKTILEPLFRKNKAVVDFFLSNVVFPRYAKQFPKKLSTSSWDLAETKAQVTTGFSGTNDNQYLLPTSMHQNITTIAGDPFGQLATNAKVLNILLRPENGTYHCLEDGNGHNPTGRDFLEHLVKQTPPVRVLLDVGAQMLDMQNTELVSRWLSLVLDLHAIVFFDDRDELVVMSRDNQVEKFVTSQYHEKMDLCAVYLDDSHTRGTDLKLPNDFRAAVTLGPKLTKDRLVQGCMRMRQLGRGQSVVFLAPKEVDQSIRTCELCPLDPSVQVGTLDILRWTMWQTCEHIRRYLPHWAQQGLDYQRRSDAWALYERDPSAPDALHKLRSSWEEPDARTLNEMYDAQVDSDTTSFHPAFELLPLKERLDRLGFSELGDNKADEEQERQVFKEAEKERQRELPPKVDPASSHLHEALKALIQKGKFKPDTASPFIPLFSPLKSKHEWSDALFSTKDFATTVRGGISVGDFLRPVNWILSVPANRVLIVLSPFEANELLPMIWKSKHVHLHIYTPRVSQNMRTTEDLRFFTIPPLPTSSDPLAFIPDLMLQLNLFAGQLYLKDFETYQRLCRMLGLIGAESGPHMWDSDGFVKPENRTGAMKEQCQMIVSPVMFLKELFSLRRKGMGYAPTHMGKILNVKPLELKDFEQ